MFDARGKNQVARLVPLKWLTGAALPQLLGKTNAENGQCSPERKPPTAERPRHVQLAFLESSSRNGRPERHGTVWAFERGCRHLCPGQATPYSRKNTTAPFSHPPGSQGRVSAMTLLVRYGGTCTHRYVLLTILLFITVSLRNLWTQSHHCSCDSGLW